MMIYFVLPISPRTKKNSGQIVMRGKYPVLLPSKQYLAFEKECLPYLYQVKNKIGIIDFPVNMECLFYMESRRKVDLANLLNAIDDASVKSGLLLDDNRDIIASHDGSRVFYDKLNPRIEVTITPVQNYTQWNNTVSKQQNLF